MAPTRHRARQPLPIDDVLGELMTALAENTRAVVVAPPGAGKTTIVPLALLDAPWMAAKRVLVLEPRRLAARAAAARMATLVGEQVGETVGVRARLATKVGPKTRVEVVTEGVFTRMIIDDPELTGVGAVLFDEFHERSLDADFGLALALDAQAGLREDLRLVVMSATLDGGRVASVLDDAPLIESAGRAFAVETHYRPRDRDRSVEQAMADAVADALRHDEGSVLAFLPGQAEILRTAELLEQRLDDPTIAICPLYGGLDLKTQDAAVQPAPSGRRKVVLASAIAETSLTIEDVRIVVDSGLARVPRFEPGARVTRLETVRAARASVDQRRGRAGRTGPGICVRLWAEAESQGLRPFEEPEIRAADLTGVMLDSAAWGVGDLRQLRWLDTPAVGPLDAARETLIQFEAIDQAGRITTRGKALRQLAMPVHLATMVLAGTRVGYARLAAELAVLIVERGLGGRATDIEERLAGFRRQRGGRASQAHGLVERWERAAKSIVGPNVTASKPCGPISAAHLLAIAFPDRIAKARGAGGRFLLVSGRGARMSTDEPLAQSQMLVAADVQGAGAEPRILSAARLRVEDLDEVAAERITNHVQHAFDRAAAAVRASRVRALGAITLSREAVAVPRDSETARILADGIVNELGIDRLPWTKALRQLRARVGFVGREGHDWPDLSDDALRRSPADWLAPFLLGKAELAEVSPSDLVAAIDALLPWQHRQELEALAPTHFMAPTGNRHVIDYVGEHAPAVAVRVQELFGLATHPAIAAGRLPLTLTLLSPAHRPIQVTRDLPGFWAGSWRDVRADMRGRYPKHVWPEDPATAQPTTRAKPRQR